MIWRRPDTVLKFGLEGYTLSGAVVPLKEERIVYRLFAVAATLASLAAIAGAFRAW